VEASSFTFAGMLISLAVGLGIGVYAGAKKITINDGKHRAFWRWLLVDLAFGLASAALHVWIVTA